MTVVVMMSRSVNHARKSGAIAMARNMAVMTVTIPAIAVHDRAGHGRAIIVVMHGVGITTAVVRIEIRTTVGIPSGNGTFLIGRHRCEVAGTAEHRPLIDIIVLRRRRQALLTSEAVTAVIAWIITRYAGAV